MSRDILLMIQGQMKEFSKGKKRIGQFILDNYDKAAFMTAAKLGETVNISESTVVRFAADLGYDGYPAMQKALQEIIRSKLTSVQRIEVSNDRLGDQDILATVVQSDIEKMRLSLEGIDRGEFSRVVDAIVGAKKIYIIGVRSAAALSDFLAFYFNLIVDHVSQVKTTLASEMFEQLLRVGPGDVVIGISFPRYSTRTVRAMEFARDQGATVVAVTDSELSPLYATASLHLLAKSDMASFVDSLVAPLSVLNALIVAVGRKRAAEVTETFSRLESIWDEYQVYEKVEYPENNK
ncbi:MAG: MurR/RpiR family transcriptional regulator [Oscillospiraceae bacterium]|nr:MurR/RpiR family transcriptional regulator [Oscillospiraceae bacterium]